MTKIYDIDKISSVFTQRSKIFLYPLVYIPKGINLYPKQTYISLVDVDELVISPDDKILICVYDNFTNDKDLKDEKEHILLNKYFHDVKPISSTETMYIFKLNRLYLDHDWDVFLSGDYSLMSPLTKKTISDFYKDSPQEAYVNSYLYPDNYYEKYAQILDIPVNILQDNIELLSPPDIKLETLFI